MSKTEANAPVDLSVMLGSGETFEAKGNTYTVKPITLEHIEEFMADNLSIGSQLFNVANKDSKEKVDRWLKCYCFDENGEAISLKQAMSDGWDIVDLKNFFRKLCDLSG